MGFLRILLAIAVFAFHSNIEIFPGINTLDGRTAVFCFFVVSGFYMEMVLTEKYTLSHLGKDWKKKFWIARYLRLYPIYILIALLTIATALSTSLTDLPKILLPPENANFIIICKAIAAWIINISMLGLNLPSTSDLLIGPGWSLGVEVAFYAIAPFTIGLDKKKLWFLCATGVALQFIPYGQHSPIIFGFHFFFIGALAYRYRTTILLNTNKIWKPNSITLIVFTLLLVTVALPNNIYLGTPNSHSHNTLDRLIYPLVFAYLIPLLHEHTSQNKTDYWIGQLSYPFYLVHALAIDAFGEIEISTNANFKNLIIFAVCASISAILVLIESRYVEPQRRKFMK